MTRYQATEAIRKVIDAKGCADLKTNTPEVQERFDLELEQAIKALFFALTQRLPSPREMEVMLYY